MKFVLVNVSKGSYSARCNGAVLAFNTKETHSSFQETLYGSPRSIVQKMEENRANRAKTQRKYKNLRKNKREPKAVSVSCGPDYGDNCQKADMPEEEYDRQKKMFLQQLNKTQEEKNRLELTTRLQADSGIWLEERRKILTASNFYKVCRR